MSIDRQTITIYWDEQDRQNIGWAYRIDGGTSGAIDGDASEAVQMIVDGVEGADLDALRGAIEWKRGDMVAITGPGMPGSLGDLLDSTTPAMDTHRSRLTEAEYKISEVLRRALCVREPMQLTAREIARRCESDYVVYGIWPGLREARKILAKRERIESESQR